MSGLSTLIIVVVGGGFLAFGAMWVLRKMKGNIDLSVKQSTVSPGELFMGDVLLEFKKPMQSNNLKVTLFAKEEVREYDDGKYKTSHREIYRDSVRLKGATSYQAAQTITYPFEITVPQMNGMVQGKMGEAMEMMSNLASAFMQRDRKIVWSLEARLDAPGLDLVATSPVQVRMVRA